MAKKSSNSSSTKAFNKESKGIKRFPRPLGLTLMVQQSQSDKDPISQSKKQENIKNLIIDQWVANSMMLSNRRYTIQDMGILLSLPVTAIMSRMNHSMERLGMILMDDGIGRIARVLILQSLNLGLETVAMAKQQASQLIAAQGDTYVPFLSNTVNGAIDNLIKANKPLTNLLEILKNPTQPGYQNPGQEGPKTHQITPDEAIRIVRSQSQSILEDPQSLETSYALITAQSSIPDVNARHQNLTGIGIKNPNPISDKGTETGDNKADMATIEVPPSGPLTAKRRKDILDQDIIDDATFEDFVA